MLEHPGTPRWRPRLAAALFCAVFLQAAGAQSALESWRGGWTPYLIIDDFGQQRRLLRATMRSPLENRVELILKRADRSIIDRQWIPARSGESVAHGFWVPQKDAVAGEFTLECRAGDRLIGSRRVTVRDGGQPVTELPLRLDRLNRGLLDRLTKREAASREPALQGMAEYVAQHDIVYESPAPSWVEGLPLGNGEAGALVFGTQGREQVIDLDKTDIWFASRDGEPLGRSWAGSVRVRYQASGPFHQRLSLGTGEVVTEDGAFRSRIRVDASRNVVQLELAGADAEVVLERKPATLWQDRRSGYHNASRLFGSWANITSPALIEQLRADASQSPATTLDWSTQPGECSFVHRAPNLSVAVVAGAPGLRWTGQDGGCSARIRPPRRGWAVIEFALATDRESRDPLARARSLLGKTGRVDHVAWWREFWNRSWIELPDKLEESLWYIGLYQQAAASRSDQAVSFFGLWHPLDYRTWYDCYVADAQAEMIWWLTFPTNHLELLYPSHRTFGRLAAEFARESDGAGTSIPHMFHPEWAGGSGSYGVPNPHRGSLAWYTLNFWWDYAYSGDREFLRDVTYPLMRMVADRLLADLVKQDDGRYHSLHSQSPEQDATDRDNIYDWAMLTAFFRAMVQASEQLGVDAPLRPQWRERLENLFAMPSDGKTIWEAPHNPHPYRCHPVVFFGLHPTNAIAHGSAEFESARRTMPVVTRLIGFRYEDRHAKIPDFEGGIEPNGFSSGILTTSAARLGDRNLYRRFLRGLIVRYHLKQNGLCALIDTRQSDDISRASLVEAANAHTVAISETLLQSWDDHVRIFPCIESGGRVRFAGLRAAGGFVVSGEAEDGALVWARVKSLLGRELRAAFPSRGPVSVREEGSGAAVPVQWIRSSYGEHRLQIATVAGKTYEILTRGAAVHMRVPPAKPRMSPVPISIAQLEGESALTQYPEDLPFGQEVHDGNLYLGRPASYGTSRQLPFEPDVVAAAKSPDWQARQRAARLLSRLQPSVGVLAALDALCRDAVDVVAHTAAVSLVHLGTLEALAIARKHAAMDRVPGLAREVEKAQRRLGRP